MPQRYRIADGSMQPDEDGDYIAAKDFDRLMEAARAVVKSAGQDDDVFELAKLVDELGD